MGVTVGLEMHKYLIETEMVHKQKQDKKKEVGG